MVSKEPRTDGCLKVNLVCGAKLALEVQQRLRAATVEPSIGDVVGRSTEVVAGELAQRLRQPARSKCFVDFNNIHIGLPL
jgi:hypothetical protein